MSCLKLNIGCGPSGLKGWLNYDWGVLPLLSKLNTIRRFLIFLKIIPQEYDVAWPPIKLVDIRSKFPLKDGSVQYIYCSHVLEHFDRWEALKILKECRRVLEKDGGVIRLIVPDIEKMYQSYHQSAFRPGRELCRLWWGFKKDEMPKNFVQKLVRKFIRDHQWNYNRNELSILLKDAGFSKIELRSPEKGAVPDIDSLDIHKEGSLFMEAVKGPQ